MSGPEGAAGSVLPWKDPREGSSVPAPGGEKGRLGFAGEWEGLWGAAWKTLLRCL